MARPTLAETKDTKADIATVALELIQTRGFHAFSYQDLADRLGIRKASIHYHYPSKEDLGVFMVEAAMERGNVWRQKTTALKISPSEKIQAFFDYFAEVAEDGKRICPCSALVSDWSAISPRLRETVVRNGNAHREWLVSVITEGRAKGEFRKIGTALEQAHYVYSGTHGALLSSRVNGDFKIFRAVTRQILAGVRTSD